MGRRKTTEEFIASAKKLYGDRYDYSKVEYHGYEKKYVLFAQSMASGGFLHIIFLTGINAQPAAEDKELQEMFLYTEAEKSMIIDMTIQKSNIKD